MDVESYKQQFWKALRPFHAPMTRALRRRLGRNYATHPEMDLPPAYEAVQLEVERRLHKYLHRTANQVEQIVIVGAHDGSEVKRLRQSYPRCRFLCFEPSPFCFHLLDRQVEIESRQLALADTPGTAVFYELERPGNGSLLPPDRKEWARMNQSVDNTVSTYEVEVSTLDRETKDIERIDLLWIDVQGAEGRVLEGGKHTLSRTDAAFLEVTLVRSPYRGAQLFVTIDQTLAANGFTCVALGIDPWNFSGNALWVKGIEQKVMQAGEA